MIAALESSDRRGSFLAELLRRLGPRPGRLAYAARLALICALTALVVEIYQTPDPALTVYIVFFLNKPDRAESLLLDVVFTFLITLIVGIVILLAIMVIDVPFWRLVVMSAFSIGFLFVAFASKLRPIGGIVTLIVGYALDVLGTLHSGELSTRAVLYVWLFIAIPAGVSVVVNLLAAPPPRRLAERAMAERLRAAAAVLRGPDERSRHAFTEARGEGIDEIASWLKLAGLEKTSAPRDLAALRHAADCTAAILSWVDVVSREPAGFLPRPLYDRLAETLEEMARVLESGQYPIGIALEARLGESPLAAPSAEAWADMRDLLARFAEPPAPVSCPTQAAAAPAGFFQPDAFTNPAYLRYALKTTAAAMLCYVFYSLLDWPGIHTCFITCYIVALGTTAETVEKFSLRILGCMVGAAAGIAAIVYVIPALTSIGALLIIVFLGALASAWVAAGSPRISYAGFQIAFAFFLCVLQGPSPAFDLTIARDRIIGMLLGNVVVYLLFTRLWPVSVAMRIDPAIAAVLSRLSAMAVASTTTRRSLAARVQGSLGNIEQDLELARYEPSAIRPADSWLEDRRRAAREVGALEGPLLLIPDLEPTCAAEIGRRLEAAAESLAGQRTSNSSPEATRALAETRGALTPAADRHPLAAAIRMHLESLEDILRLTPSPTRGSASERRATHAPV
ncbi:MAG TPA: FUSC family protein [Steroidobacteraceae bacterium]|nr:FUSC family protein [Steroidobacteraceae bacterium]